MAQISIRSNLLKRYNNKFRRNEKDVKLSALLVVATQSLRHRLGYLAEKVTCSPLLT